MKKVFFYDSDLGPIGVAENGHALTDLYFGNEPLDDQFAIEETPLLKKAAIELFEYLAGKRLEFDLPLEPVGTEFQQTVWQALIAIPYGQTRSYKQVAEAVGSPKAFRAVGLANNRNPIAIIIPCHRVVGADGSLVGYGGGLDKKISLLKLEKADVDQQLNLSL